MSLTNVWLQMFDGSLVRADQVTEIELHQTPEIAGKPSHWLLNVVIPVSVGGGGGGGYDGWRIGAAHRTLTQISIPPTGVPVALARLLSQLDAVDAAGVVRAEITTVRTAPHPGHTVSAGPVILGFDTFTGGNPDEPSGLEQLRERVSRS